eukprot:1165410-Prorocentrum_minimum.AAC.1
MKASIIIAKACIQRFARRLQPSPRAEHTGTWRSANNGGEPNSPVVERLNKGLNGLSYPSPRAQRRGTGRRGRGPPPPRPSSRRAQRGGARPPPSPGSSSASSAGTASASRQQPVEQPAQSAQSAQSARQPQSQWFGHSSSVSPGTVAGRSRRHRGHR